MKNSSKLTRIGLFVLLFWTVCSILHLKPTYAATVTLSWDANVPAPAGYRIFQRVEGQAYDYTSPAWPTDGNDHTETTCTLEGLTEGVTYYFVVKAYAGQDQSGDSNEVQYQLAGTDSPGDTVAAEPDITETGAGETDAVADGGVETPPLEETAGVTPDTTETGTSETEVVTDGGVEPSLSAEPADAKTVTLLWDANEPAPAGYRVFQRVEGQAYDYTSPVWPTDGSDHTETTCTLGGLTEGVTYYFVVKAYSGQEESGDSNEVQLQLAGAGETDAGADGGVEPPVSDETAGVTPDITKPGSGESGNDIEGIVIQPPSVQPGYEAEFRPSLEIFNNSYSHQSWLSVQWSQNVLPDGESRIAMGDIDGDGKDEIIIGLGQIYDPSLPGGLFQIIDDDYSLIGWGQIDWPDYNLANGESYPSCGDIDGDGDDEILLGLGVGGQGMVEVLDFKNGSVVHMDWITVDWPEYNALLGDTHPTAGDIDNDGKDEIIIGLGSDDSNPQMPTGRFQILDDDFSQISWGQIDWVEYNENNGESYPSTGDIGGDGKERIIIGLGSGGGGRVETFQYDAGSVTHSGWVTIDWNDYNQAVGRTRPVSGDIDGDGRDELIVGLGADSDHPEFPGGKFQIIDDDATHIAWAQIQWPDYNSVNGESYPAVGDINADGVDDIFVGLGIQAPLTTDEGQTLLDTPQPSQSPSSTSGSGGGGGCFMNTLFPQRF